MYVYEDKSFIKFPKTSGSHGLVKRKKFGYKY